ncbi:aminopeptidase P family protein [Wenyingzhuangia aestuarii]|uniref:aminopeptidase P family protein n=1 Tax=Wenyingzhuangia aestuarii TaxID=1647582 RepID=UPI001438750F|nr:aminopeptidase P family protein [Wenyingzhuangia aestuarii]NJB81309.1 Xaa-Pro aminopeptidase [Wenyingzhuangia aestuarii]
MKYNTINPQLFIENRKRFTERMETNSIAFFNANDIFITGADSALPFEQHRDLFYLSGVDQEESVLVLFPDAKNPQYKEILFVTETNEHIAIWEGEKLSKQQATEVSGIATVFWLSELENVIASLIKEATNIYINENNHKRAPRYMETREDRFIKKLKQEYPKHTYKSSFDILFELRGIKSAIEIELIQQACNITKKGFERVLSFTKPNVWEYEIEAELIHEFIRNRSKGFAYTPIVASGYSACVLHYIENNKPCKNGDLILMDVAAEYANYSSDLTRTIPANGRFTDRQKAVYQSVLNVKNQATQMIREGLQWKEYNLAVGELMTAELLSLKLLDKADIQNQTKEKPAYKKYFMHGTSHHLGLDTHDYGDFENDMKTNMVLTVEPGIYIPKEKLGIRLEDDIVVQKNAEPINLTKHIPIEIEEIENLMNP